MMASDAVVNAMTTQSLTPPFVPRENSILKHKIDGGPVRARSHKTRRLDLDAEGELSDSKKAPASPTAASQMAHFLLSEEEFQLPSSSPEPSPHIPVDHQLRRWWHVPGSGDAIELTFDMAFECPNEEPHGRSTDEESIPEKEKDVRSARLRRWNAEPNCHVTSQPIWIPYC